MYYFFSDFVFDTEKKQLTYQGNPVQLTQKNYDLLGYFLANNEQIHTKDELVEHVWQGRVVTDNTVDQSILKLRNILNDCHQATYIETIYGRGVQFKPKVTVSKTKQNKQHHNILLRLLPVVIVLVILAGWLLMPASNDLKPKPQLLIKTSQSDADWLQSGLDTLFSQVLNYSGSAQVVDMSDKPKYLGDEQFIKNQLTLKPRLQTIQTHIKKQNGSYQLDIIIESSEQDINRQFEHSDLSHLMAEGMRWVLSKTSHTEIAASRWMPDNDHVMELYLRAMDSVDNNQFDKARKQLELVLTEAPDFLLAKYQMAHVLTLENKHTESLALLDTLLQQPINDTLTVAVLSLKAFILDTLGQYDDALAIYEELFKNNSQNHSLARLKARYEFSQVLVNTNQSQQANTQLDIIIQHLNETENSALLADASALKGSLMQRLGHMPEAEVQLSRALNLYQQNEDVLGLARTYSALARIANHQAKYELAESYLHESLAITRNIGFRLGEGATLNELAYVKMKQGHLDEGQELAQHMQQIGIEIDYPAMQIAARQALFDVARAKKDWQVAQRHLDRHQQLAEQTNNQRALIKNKMLTLSLRADTRQLNQTSDLIQALQTHIDQQNEVRMQPRLDWLKARIQFQQNRNQAAKDLLNEAKQQALAQEDGETLIEINNTLAEIMLSENQPQKALDVLNASAPFDPFAMPYLKLQAQAHHALGNSIKALELMNLCKLKSFDFWTPEDNDYLKALIAEMSQ